MPGPLQTIEDFFFEVSLGESGCFPPPVFLRETAHLLCSFLAELTMLLHFSFTSIASRLQTPRAFTLFVISSHTLLLFLFVKVDENVLLMTFKFSSAFSKITAHSAGVKFGFLARFAGEGSTRNLVTMATAWIAIYPSDS